MANDFIMVEGHVRKEMNSERFYGDNLTMCVRKLWSISCVPRNVFVSLVLGSCAVGHLACMFPCCWVW